MGILEAIVKELGAGGIQQVARSAGISEQDMLNLLSRLVPSVAQGIKSNASDVDGASHLLSALEKGHHERYLENPEVLDRPETIEDGNAILGHVFGSKAVSRSVAGKTAEETGVDATIVKRLLPVVASIAMGALSKQANRSGLVGAQAQAGDTAQSALGLLTSFLDVDKDGSIADDLLDMMKKLF